MSFFLPCRPDQRVVPTTLGFFYTTDPMNATMLARMDAYCVDNARHFAQARVAHLLRRPSHTHAHTHTSTRTRTQPSHSPPPSSLLAQWAREDARLIGMFPFYWNTQAGMIGLEDLPRCQAEWVALGREIVGAAAAISAGGLPRGGGQPGRRHVCPSPEEKVKHHWCRKDV